MELSPPAFESLFAKAMAEATKFSNWSKLDPRYVEEFKQTWLSLEGRRDSIDVDSILTFAGSMAARWPDWKLSDSDFATLRRFPDRIPMVAFARFSEDDNFPVEEYLNAPGSGGSGPPQGAFIVGPDGKRDDDVMDNYSKHYCSATMGGQCQYKTGSRTCKRCGETK